MATLSSSAVHSQLSTPISSSGSSSPLPASREIPKDFRSSLSAWWSTSSYREARIAEERLLRRLSFFPPAPAEAKDEERGSVASDGSAVHLNGQVQKEAQVPLVSSIAADGKMRLVATLRNVFIPTPNPSDAPLHPADPREPSGEVATESTSSVSSSSDLPGKKKHHLCKKPDEVKLVDYINTLEISAPENKDSKEAVVVLHGYAAAHGFFFRNWESIAQSAAETGRRTHYLDWLGMGLSSRPSPNLLSSPSGAHIPSRVARAEHFFLSSLESWREVMGVEKMVLVGHSLGGYLASAYAVRYPERVSGLILVSPAGIPHGPEYTSYPLTSEASSRPQSNREQSETASELDQAVDAAEMEFGQQGGAAHEPKGEAKQWQRDQKPSLIRRGFMKFFVWGWERGLSPLSILRGIGPWGPQAVGRYSSRRFASQKQEDIRDIHSYIYGTSTMKGSGEYCISHLLAPGAYARIPILDRIGRLRVPVTFMYGDNDWMDVQGGHDSASVLAAAGNLNCNVHVVPEAGHHLYLDNPEASNKIFDEAIKAVPKML